MQGCKGGFQPTQGPLKIYLQSRYNDHSDVTSATCLKLACIRTVAMMTKKVVTDYVKFTDFSSQHTSAVLYSSSVNFHCTNASVLLTTSAFCN